MASSEDYKRYVDRMSEKNLEPEPEIKWLFSPKIMAYERYFDQAMEFTNFPMNYSEWLKD